MFLIYIFKIPQIKIYFSDCRTVCLLKKKNQIQKDAVSLSRVLSLPYPSTGCLEISTLILRKTIFTFEVKILYLVKH